LQIETSILDLQDYQKRFLQFKQTIPAVNLRHASWSRYAENATPSLLRHGTACITSEQIEGARAKVRRGKPYRPQWLTQIQRAKQSAAFYGSEIA
jgi:hypothetical protein